METLEDTPLWELVHHYAYPPFEAQLATLRGASEDDVTRLVVWCIETIAGDPEHITPFTTTFHDKVVASIRRADNSAHINDTNTAATLVCTVAAICLEPLVGDDFRIEKAYRGLVRSLAEKHDHADGVRLEIMHHYTSYLHRQLGEWIKQFLSREEYLTDDLGRWATATADDTDATAPAVCIAKNKKEKFYVVMHLLMKDGVFVDEQGKTMTQEKVSNALGAVIEGINSKSLTANVGNAKQNDRYVAQINDLLKVAKDVQKEYDNNK